MVSVVLPTYRERDSIADCVRGFEKAGVVDEIIVVNNNAQDGTSEQVAFTSAREVMESRQGYGAAIRRGLAEASGDLICICEPDGTFDPHDILKLLPYTAECRAVLGSRTVSTFIWSGANMDWFLRWGNWAVAKLIEALFNTPYLSDVGCTMRVMSKDLVEEMQPRFRGEGSSFGMELLLLTVISRTKFVQVPVNYRERVGQSAVTGDRSKAFTLGIEMIRMVLSYRLRSLAVARRLSRW